MSDQPVVVLLEPRSGTHHHAALLAAGGTGRRREAGGGGSRGARGAFSKAPGFLAVRHQHPPAATEFRSKRGVPLEGAQARVEGADDGLPNAARNETDSITGSFLLQLTRDQAVLTAKYPSEECPRALTARQVLHASLYSKNGAKLRERPGWIAFLGTDLQTAPRRCYD